MVVLSFCEICYGKLNTTALQTGRPFCGLVAAYNLVLFNILWICYSMHNTVDSRCALSARLTVPPVPFMKGNLFACRQ